MPASTCRICEQGTDELFRKLVLGRHDVGYHRCRGCGFLQTDPPAWLDEAYADAISAVDTGLLGRALSLAPRVESVIRRARDPGGRFLDYGGGSGLFVRHMRDRGFRFYRHDPHAAPVFSRYFDMQDLPGDERHFELVTAFEVLEHLHEPVREVSTMLELAEDVLFTTELVPTTEPAELSRWWYLGPEHGQHLSFYTPPALSRLAGRLGAGYVQLAPDLHLISRDPGVEGRLARPPDPRPLEPLTWSDSLHAAHRRSTEAAARSSPGRDEPANAAPRSEGDAGEAGGRAARSDVALTSTPFEPAEPAVPDPENATTHRARCWCGNADLTPFSPDYLGCARCGSLVVARAPDDPNHVRDETSSLYGLNYFNEHAREMGHPTLEERARLDLPERCAFWLRTLLRYRPPPARTLELGCANGAFVALLAEAGYQAAGLDLSPAVTGFARGAFQVPVLTGPVEEQDLPPASVDALIMMDVLEHLPDPLATLRSISPALAPDGVLLIQTPRYDPSRTLEDLRSRADAFLAQLKPQEHLLLLSPSSARALLGEAGFPFVQQVPAIFAAYDMCLVASRVPLREIAELDWRAALRRTRSGRIVEALLDAADRTRTELPALRSRLGEVLEQVHRLEAQVGDGERKRGEQVIRMDALDVRIREMESNLDRLQTIEQEYALVLRRLRFLVGVFQRRRVPRGEEQRGP